MGRVLTEQTCDRSGWRLSIVADLPQSMQSSKGNESLRNFLAGGSLGPGLGSLRIPRLASVKSLRHFACTKTVLFGIVPTHSVKFSTFFTETNKRYQPFLRYLNGIFSFKPLPAYHTMLFTKAASTFRVVAFSHER